MAHYDKIPDLLNHLITASAAESCRRVGITSQTHWHWIVESKLGKPELQSIEWMNITAPYHVHVQNAKAISAQQIEQSAIERARDGVFVDVFFQGQRCYKTLAPKDHKLLVELGLQDADDPYEYVDGQRVPEQQWMKPSDAIVLKMLEAWQRKRYGAHQTVDVNYGGTLRLQRDGTSQPSTKPVIDAESAVITDDESEQSEQPRQLALAAPAKDAAEMDELIKAGAFEPQEVVFVDAAGNRTVRKAAPDPALDDPPEFIGANPGTLAEPPRGVDHTKEATHARYDDRVPRPGSPIIGSDGYPTRTPQRPQSRGQINARDPNGIERTGTERVIRDGIKVV